MSAPATANKRPDSGCLLEDLENKASTSSSTDAEAPAITDKDTVAPEVINVGSAIGAMPASPMKKANKATFDDDDTYGNMSAVSTLSIGDMCKICHCGGETNASLITPCFCSGSLKYVHQECLQRWIKSSDIKRCELCKYPFAMQAKVKPFCQWEKLDMTVLERRKLLCSVTFHVVAITCVVWSLYVLIDRTAQEIRNGELQWPFWTKLVVVAIGFTGGLVFMYIQCKVYVHLCRKWKAYNRIIVVQDAPEGVHKPDGQFSKPMADNCTNATPTSGPSRRSSSAPTVHNAIGREVAQTPVTSSSVGNNTTEKTNAETQTALRGVSILEGECGHTHHTNSSSSGLDAPSSAIFFTECECRHPKPIKHHASDRQRSGHNKRGRGPGGPGIKSMHSSSTPNVSSRLTRRDRSEGPPSKISPSDETRQVKRQLSLSPTRQTDLPGSPDQIDERPPDVPDRRKGGRAKRSNTTIVSPLLRN